MIGDVTSLKGKKVLLTGATGFVGGHLAERLLELGANLSVLIRRAEGSPEARSFEEKGAKVFLGDVAKQADVFRAVEGQELVFHLAALFRQAKHGDQVYWDINVEGVKHVLDACEEFGVQRLVHCSTVGVHSHIPHPPADETEEYRPGDIYQETKCEGEKLVQERIQRGQLDAVVVRPAMIWGEGDRRMLKLFKGVAKRKFPIIGSGKTLTHWVYVHDLVSGFLLAGVTPRAKGETYIFAGKTPASIEELVRAVADVAGVKPLPVKIPAWPVQMLGSLTEIVCKPLGIEPPIYRRRVDFFTKDRCFDITKAREQLAYEPAQEFKDEVSNIYRWYEDQGWLN